METSPIFDSFTLTVPEELSLLAGKTQGWPDFFARGPIFNILRAAKKLSLFFSHNKQKKLQFTGILFKIKSKK